MLVALPLLAFVLMCVFWRRRLPDWRDRFVVAAVLWGLYAVVLTETLSELTALTPIFVAGGWLLACVAVIVAAEFMPASEMKPAALSDRVGRWLLLSPVVILASGLAAIAWMGPPNNADSMVYHMPRVFHWIQDRNVAFFPCTCPRQIEMAPGGEYLILQFQILSKSDHWADMMQWFAYVGCIVGVSSIARLLGGGPRAQMFAAVVMATLPIACLEAETTQNDLVSAFWLVCFLVFLLQIVAAGSPAARTTIFLLCGASLGLALVTKSTLYIFTAPFGLVLAAITLYRMRSRGAVFLAVLLAVALTLSVPTFVRNYRFSHTLLGNGGFGPRGNYYTNAHYGGRETASNILRNVGLELAIGTPSFQLGIENVIRTVHGWLGLNPDDPDTMLRGTQFHMEWIPWNSEDYAPNPAHVALIAAAFLTLLVYGWKERRGALYVSLGIVAGFIFFCAYLRWQLWHDRLHLPLLVVSCALIGVVMERYWNRWVALAIAALLPLLVIPWIVLAANHPLVGDGSIFRNPRVTRYFYEEQLYAQYCEIVKLAVDNHVKQVAFIGDGDTWEYPLDRMLSRNVPGVRIGAGPYPGTWTAAVLDTNNTGLDLSVKPYLVVDLRGRTAKAVDIQR